MLLSDSRLLRYSDFRLRILIPHHLLYWKNWSFLHQLCQVFLYPFLLLGIQYPFLSEAFVFPSFDEAGSSSAYASVLESEASLCGALEELDACSS